MWKILIESLRKGVAATAAPQETELPPERFRGLVMLNPELCDLSGACVVACPTGAITLSDDPAQRLVTWEVDHARCIFCGLCQEACPRGAITLGNKYRLAVKAKDDLRVAVTLPPASREARP